MEKPETIKKNFNGMCNKNFFLLFPTQIVNGQYVEGFYIYSIKASSNGAYKMLTALHGAGGASACTITQLERNTVYDFFLIPFYKSIEGKPSNLIQTATLEDGKLSDFKWFLTY
jgi:hypothetical protein